MWFFSCSASRAGDLVTIGGSESTLRVYHRLFVAKLVRNGEFLTTFSAASSEYFATVSGSHTCAEAVFVDSFPL